MGDHRFRQMARDYFTLTRSERNGMLLLGGLLLVSLLLNIVAGKRGFPARKIPGEARALLEQIPLPQENGPAVGRLFAFDPNTISPEALDSLALPRQIRQNLLRYRSRGGKLRQPKDFGRLYGMNDSLMALLLPFIEIPGAPAPARGTPFASTRAAPYALPRSARNSPAGFPSGDPSPTPSRGSTTGAYGPDRTHSSGERQRELFPFDPSTVTEEELKKLGFSDYQRRNLLGFRAHGGKFRKKEDLRKIYGIDSAFYQELERWIVVGSPVTEQLPLQSPPSTPMELNLADSALLTTLPGIGPVFAGRIIRYRTKLGGFASLDQLREVYGMTEERFLLLIPWLTADPELITPLRINFADTRTLANHPYVGRTLSRAIPDFRSAHGPFLSPAQLLENSMVDSLAFLKLVPYLSCH